HSTCDLVLHQPHHSRQNAHTIASPYDASNFTDMCKKFRTSEEKKETRCSACSAASDVEATFVKHILIVPVVRVPHPVFPTASGLNLVVVVGAGPSKLLLHHALVDEREASESILQCWGK